MKKLELRKLPAVSKFLKRLPRFVAEHVFWASLAFVALAAILGAWTFYKYSFLAERKEPGSPEQPLVLDEKIIQEILRTRLELQNRFDQAKLKEYPHPFRFDLPK
jgi:hypothetical protein